MPKKKIQVMVDSELYQSIEDFCKVTRQSMSGAVADYLLMAKPTFDRMTASLKGFSELTDKQKQAFVEGLQESEKIARDQVQEALVVMNTALSMPDSRQLSLDVQGVSAARPARAADPSTNRGDSSPKRKQPKPAPSKALKEVQPKKKIQKVEG